MTTLTEPFDVSQIPPRLVVRKQTKFDFSRTPAIHTAGNAYISHFLNAFSLAAPITEGVLLRTAARIRDSIKDPQLAEELKAFIGQEAMHTREHRRLNQRLAELGYHADDVVADIEQWVQTTEAKMTTQQLVAVSVVGEHATLSVGRTLLNNTSFMDDADPEVRRLMIWHCMEEVEHQSTFDELYTHLYGGGIDRRLQYMKQFAFASSLVGTWAARIMLALLRRDPMPPLSQLLEFASWAVAKPAIATGITVELLKFLLPGYEHWSEPRSDIQSLNAAYQSIYPDAALAAGTV